MMDVLFTGGAMLLGADLLEGQALAVAGERIAWIGPAAEAPPARRFVNLDGRLLLPGFIDVQVNGGGGMLFNDERSVEAIVTIASAHARYGTTGFLPTLISDSLCVINSAVRAVDAAIAAQVPGVLGIHLEGPFLNPARRGIHPAEWLIPPDQGTVSRLASLRSGKTLITLAPEVTGDALIAALVVKGALVSIGHTQATSAQVQSALAAGARGFTHLFNAMPPLINRSPGPVGAALVDQTAWCGLIVDGHHVDPIALRVALACRPLDRFMLITDAMALIGEAGGTFTFNGETITVADGRSLNPAGVLAGSALDMASAVRRARDELGLTLPQAVAMATSSPAAFLGMSNEIGVLAKGYRANLVVADSGLIVHQTWIAGSSVFSSSLS